MKHYLSILLCILLGCSFVSCEKDMPPRPVEYIEGWLLDGGTISGIRLTANQTQYTNYSDVKIELFLNQGTSPFLSVINPGNHEKIQEMKKKYVLPKSLFILNSYKDAITSLDIDSWNGQWPNLFTAYVNGDVTITCDKPLFGEVPGTNLSKYFKITTEGSCLPVGVTEPYLLYDFGDSIPTNMHDYFIKEAWLQYSYNLYFDEAPSEQYDDLTLRVSIPMLQECYGDYIVAEYIGQPLESKYKESTFTSSLKIKFDWK